MSPTKASTARRTSSTHGKPEIGYLFSRSVRQLSQKEQVWVLLKDRYQDVKNKEGELLYRIKSCTDDFLYKYMDPDGKEKTVLLKEKRVAAFNPHLAKKQLLEINRQVEKAMALKACQAKKRNMETVRNM